MTQMTHDQISEIVTSACQAPSGDNCQPWQFEWDEKKLKVFLIEDKDHSFYNVLQRYSIVSIGAAIENICIRAKSLGFDAKVQDAPDIKIGTENKVLLSEITFVPGEQEEDLSAFIEKRCMNRKPYNQETLSDEIIQELEKEMKGFPEISFQPIIGLEKIKKGGKLQSLSPKAMLSDKNFCGKNLRFGNDLPYMAELPIILGFRPCGTCVSLCFLSAREVEFSHSTRPWKKCDWTGSHNLPIVLALK